MKTNKHIHSLGLLCAYATIIIIIIYKFISRLMNRLRTHLLQSSEAYEFIKRDLTEFSNVVQHDTACSIVATANAVKTKLAVCFPISHTYMKI